MDWKKLRKLVCLLASVYAAWLTAGKIITTGPYTVGTSYDHILQQFSVLLGPTAAFFIAMNLSWLLMRLPFDEMPRVTPLPQPEKKRSI